MTGWQGGGLTLAILGEQKQSQLVSATVCSCAHISSMTGPSAAASNAFSAVFGVVCRRMDLDGYLYITGRSKDVINR